MVKRKLIRIVVPLLITGVLSALILVSVKEYVQYKEIFEDVAAWSAFFSVFGIVYAIVAGFFIGYSFNKI